MSVKAISPSELLQSLRGILPQVTCLTQLEANLDDGSSTKRSCRDWIETAEATRKAAQKLTPELIQLEQFEFALRYRTQTIRSEAALDLEQPLTALCRTLSQRLFPNGIPDDFAAKQIRYICSKYTDYVKKLLDPSYEELAIGFFKFCLQAPSLSSHQEIGVAHWVDIFISYPEVAKRLMKSPLYEKLGRYPEKIDILEEKGVCIEMELSDPNRKWVPLNLKPGAHFCLNNKAPESSGLSLTLEEFFKQFEGPQTPDIDVSMNGIINLNPYLLASKNGKGTLDLIDPAKWTEYKPSVDLTEPKLRKLYPRQIKNDPPYGFVLRADLHLALNRQQPFFDFVMRLENGNYRVFHMNAHQGPGAALYQQKMVFFPLPKERGEDLIRKVADDITNYRKAQSEGKQPPSIDVQSYIDEVLGHTFYTALKDLVHALHPLNPQQTQAEVDARLAEVRKNLDPDAFEQFMQPVVEKLVKKRDIPHIHQLIKASLETLYFVLQKEGSLPTLEAVNQAFVKEYPHNEAATIKQSLLILTRLCFEVLHPYRITVAEAERETPVIGRIFLAIETIPWKKLRDLLNNLMLVALGKWRGYHYRTIEGPEGSRFAKIIRSIRQLKPEKHLNRASQLFTSYSEEQLKKIIERLQAQSTVLVGSS